MPAAQQRLSLHCNCLHKCKCLHLSLLSASLPTLDKHSSGCMATEMTSCSHQAFAPDLQGVRRRAQSAIVQPCKTSQATASGVGQQTAAVQDTHSGLFGRPLRALVSTPHLPSSTRRGRMPSKVAALQMIWPPLGTLEMALHCCTTVPVYSTVLDVGLTCTAAGIRSALHHARSSTYAWWLSTDELAHLQWQSQAAL